MAVFPPYEPDERSYDLGAHPVVTQQAGLVVPCASGPAPSALAL